MINNNECCFDFVVLFIRDVYPIGLEIFGRNSKKMDIIMQTNMLKMSSISL